MRAFGRIGKGRPMALKLRQRTMGCLMWIVAMIVMAADEPVAPSGSAAITRDDIRRALSDARTVFSRFVQERHLSLFQEPLRSEGYLCFQRPGRLRWETTSPYRSILVTDGSGAAQFEWVGDQWKKLDLGLSVALEQVLAQIAGVMEGNYTSDRRGYLATVSVEADGPKVVLVPQNEKTRKMISAIEVYLDRDLRGTRRVLLRETGGDYTDIRFEDPWINGTFPERTFDLRNPADIAGIREAMRSAKPSTPP